MMKIKVFDEYNIADGFGKVKGTKKYLFITFQAIKKRIKK